MPLNTNQSVSEILLMGDKIKLSDRSSSKSSICLKTQNSAKYCRRSASAIPRLFSNKNMQEDVLKTNRPFSADCQNPYKNKTNNSSTTSSLENISVHSNNSSLPSSNLLKNLLEEDIASWSPPSLVASSRDELNDNEKIEVIIDIDNVIKDEIPTLELNFDNEEVSKETRECVLTPGLATKPPLPKKVNEGGSEIKEDLSHNNVIYDYFTIKYSLENQKGESNFHNVECDIPEKENNSLGVKSITSPKNDKQTKDISPSKKNLTTSSHVNISSPIKDTISDQQFISNDVESLSKTFTLLDEFESEKNLAPSVQQNLDDDDFFLSKLDLDELFHFPREVKAEPKKTVPKEHSTSKCDKVSAAPKKPKGKFAAFPIKAPACSYERPELEDVESWVARNDAAEADRCKGTPRKQDFDEIENILEVLEYQDKTAQSKINTMKKIVTSELSNSLLVNDGSDLTFKKSRDVDSHERETQTHFQKIAEILKDVEADDGNEKYVDLDKKEKSRDQKSARKQDGNDDNEPSRDDATKDKDNYYSTYNDLLSYLDDVDKKCFETLEIAKERAISANKLIAESSLGLNNVPKLDDLLNYDKDELATYVIELTLRVKDKTSSVAMLQHELNAVREKLLERTRHSECEMRKKLKQQKEETEAIAKRHQKFIDQLMEEKKTLQRKCEDLVGDMKTLEERYASNMKAVEQRHNLEMQKLKDMHSVSEKYKRERWIEGRTQKIKDMAVKSIEPEIQNMEKRHQQEISELRALHKREIEELELRAARKLQSHSEKLREQLVADREKALEHEREVMRMRYEKMVESEERNYQEQRRRLLADHSNRIKECEEREANNQAEKERAIKLAQEDFEERLQAITRRHANELKLVKETAILEMENWKNSYRKQQQAVLQEKEAAIRKECRNERDKEIEIVIERLENEANRVKQQTEQTTENRIKRIKEKYESEIRDLEILEKDAQNKYCETKTKLLEYEDTILTLRTSLRQIESQIADLNLERAKLLNDKEQLKDQIKREYEEEINNLKDEVNELKTAGTKQVEQLYSRVRVSLARKDELLKELTDDHKALQEKCVYLENVIEQQRKEFLIQ